MTTEEEVTNTALVPLVKGEALDLFKNEDAAVMLIEKVKDVAGEMLESLGDVDFNVKAQRDKVISVAFDVTRTKTYIETFGKDIAAELKALPKLVDANRKKIRDELDSLAEKIRKPVTEWERAKKEKDEADALAAAMPLMHEEALAMNHQYDLQAAEDERIRLEREESIRQEAIAQAERTKKLEIERAVQTEKDRVKADQEKKAADDLRRASDIENKRRVNNEALDSLCEQCGIDSDTAVKIIKCIAMGKIKNITINY